MDERRKSPRYSEYVDLKMFVYDATIKPAKITNFKAWSLDVSLGGFRMESAQELAAGSIIGFTANGDMPSRDMSGIGEVRWCQPSGKSGCFEYGISALYNRYLAS
jgi:hypothetical protein